MDSLVVPAGSIRVARTAATLQDGGAALIIEDFHLPDAYINAGESVVWTNVDGVPHSVTSGYLGVAEKGFDSGYIGTGQSFTQKFDQPGEYRYTCTLHPSMNGTVLVTE